MKVYTAHSRIALTGDPARDTENLVFVKDGFSLWAALFPMLWFLFNRMWIPFLAYLAFSIGFSFAITQLGWSDGAVFPMGLAIALLIGFEANSLRRWSLAGKGYQLVAIGAGQTREDCERRIYEKLVDAASRPYSSPMGEAVPADASPSTSGARSKSMPIVGLFPEPRR